VKVQNIKGQEGGEKKKQRIRMKREGMVWGERTGVSFIEKIRKKKRRPLKKGKGVLLWGKSR